MPASNISAYEMTEDANCPYCEDTGRRKKYVCRRHVWCYTRWYENLRKGLEP
jgi:hypothetical protein